MYRIGVIFLVNFLVSIPANPGMFLSLSNHLTKFHYGSLMDDHKSRLRLNHLQMGESIRNRHG